MEHHVQVWRGLFKTNETIHTLRDSKALHGYGVRLLILLLCSSLVFGLWFYIGASDWLRMPDAIKMQLTAEQELAVTILIGVGGAISGLTFPIVSIGIAALFFWFFFRDIGYKKLFVLHTYLYVIILVGLSANLPFLFQYGSTSMLSPFGFGPWVKAITDNIFMYTFFGWVTIFFVWHMIAAMRLLLGTSRKSKRYVLMVTIGLHLLFLILIALTQSMYHLHI